MDTFLLNGILWRVKVVSPNNKMLIDRTNHKTVATTDPLTRCIYLSEELEGDFRETVLLHELGHVVMFSFNLIDEIHSFVEPDKWIYAEEWMCNFIADYGKRMLSIVKETLDDLDEEDMWMSVATALEKVFYS